MHRLGQNQDRTCSIAERRFRSKFQRELQCRLLCNLKMRVWRIEFGVQSQKAPSVCLMDRHEPNRRKRMQVVYCMCIGGFPKAWKSKLRRLEPRHNQQRSNSQLRCSFHSKHKSESGHYRYLVPPRWNLYSHQGTLSAAKRTQQRWLHHPSSFDRCTP